MRLFSRRRKPAASPPPRLLSYQVGNMQGQGVRERQEDAFASVNALDATAARTRGLFLAVADGMGGLRDGRRASQTAIASLIAGFQRLDLAGDLPAQLRDMTVASGEAVYQALRGGGGTTLATCLIYRERLYWSSVGDSFLYLRRGDGLYRLNQEQNVKTARCLEAVRAGELDGWDAGEDPEGQRLSAFLGMPELTQEPDYSLRPLPLADGDQLLLCSDGVGAVLTEEELLECLRAGAPQAVCEALQSRIETKGRPGQDNYTAIAAQAGY